MTLQKGTLNSHPIVEDSSAVGTPVVNTTEDGGDIVAQNAAVIATRRPVHICANVAAMQALVSPYLVDGQLYQTVEYTNTSGKGSNLYEYSSGSSATHDGGFVITCTAGGRFLAVDQSIADVTKFGAVGDGVADDTAAIQAAITAAAGAQEVLILPGTYNCESSISFVAGTKIRGSGKDVSILDFTVAIQTLTKGLYGESVGAGVVVDGIGFLGGQDHWDQSVSRRSLLKLDGATDFTVRNCHFEDCDTGCFITQSSADGLVENCTAKNCWYYGLGANSSSGTPSERIVFRDNVCWTDHVPELFSWDDSTDTFTISSGTTNVLEGSSLRINGTRPVNVDIYSTYYYAVNVTSTTFQISATQGGAVFDLGDTNASAVCLIGHVWAAGVRLEEAYNCTISGNRITGCAQGIRVENSNDNSLIGNHCVENAMTGIWIYNASQRNTITGNHCIDNNTGNNDNIQTYGSTGRAGRIHSGIAVDFECDNNLIVGNRCGQTTGGIGNQKYGVSINARNNNTTDQPSRTIVRANSYGLNEIAPVSDRSADSYVDEYLPDLTKAQLLSSAIAHFPLDDTTTTAVNNRGTNGTHANTPTSVSAIGSDSSAAIEYNGTSDYTDMFDSATVPTAYQLLDDSITISAWIEPTVVNGVSTNAWAGEHTIIELRTEEGSGCHVPFSFGIDTSKLMIGVSDDYTTNADRKSSTATLVVDTVYHVAVTISGNDYVLYINGVEDSSGTFAIATGDRSVSTTTSNMQIGVRSRDTGEKDRNDFDGTIDELLIWDTVLSATDIATIYATATT